ncbi:MAG: DUF2203 domain-containing protein [Cyanobacteriota bacterium]|jgi:hypothetical protein
MDHPPPEPPSQPAPWEESLQILETRLAQFKTRATQVQQARQEQSQLQGHRQELEAQWQASQSPELGAELQRMEEELSELQLSLESELLEDRQLQELFWQGLRRGIVGEAFWQAVRFGGLGLLLGWTLRG